MKLRLKHPPTYLPERDYIFSVLFKDFLGIDYAAEIHDEPRIHISVDGQEGALVVADGLFQTSPENWLAVSSMPDIPLVTWHLPHEYRHITDSIPIIYGTSPLYQSSGSTIELGLDIFGSAFFMLTRYEEIVSPTRDQHDRFPATASLGYQAGFLERPIINEYLEILWATLQRLFPNIQRKPRRHRILLSHDVDIPYFNLGLPAKRSIRPTASDLLKRHSPDLALRRLNSLLWVGNSRYDKDIYNTFDFIMELSEKRDLRSAFYFIAGHSPGPHDVRYDLDHPRIRYLMHHISDRGHEVGLHTSYDTYQNSDKTQAEFNHLRRIAEQEGIQQTGWGGRQHYLRWANPATWQNWEDAGLQYDTTLAFSDHIGYRCGVCYEYPVFNLATRQPLNLRERPLVVMEVTLSQEYMNISQDEANVRVEALNNQCKRLNGDFTMLWHNSSLSMRREKYWYNQLLTYLTSCT